MRPYVPCVSSAKNRNDAFTGAAGTRLSRHNGIELQTMYFSTSHSCGHFRRHVVLAVTKTGQFLALQTRPSYPTMLSGTVGARVNGITFLNPSIINRMIALLGITDSFRPAAIFGDMQSGRSWSRRKHFFQDSTFSNCCRKVSLILSSARLPSTISGHTKPNLS